MSRTSFFAALAAPRSSRWRRRLIVLTVLVGIVAGLGLASASGLVGARAKFLVDRSWSDLRQAAGDFNKFARARFASLSGRQPAKVGEPVVSAPSLPASGGATTGGGAVTGGQTAANSSLPRRMALPSVLMYADKNSAAYTRFKAWVDSAVSGTPGYGFEASEAVEMYQLSPETKYCDLAIRLVEAQVTAAETAINAARAPEVAGDSYLEVGTMIKDVATTLNTCGTRITASQRTRWSNYAEQAVWNVWNYQSATWGGRSFPWTGWSVNNPGNNYYYSFVEATMYWGLATGSTTWLNFLRTNKLPALQAYFAKLPGGGSSEGTGYGTAHMRLFSIYRTWYYGTGEDLATRNSHAADSIYYWVHATVPTLDRFAPIGDQSRNSMPELYDYHRRLMLEARSLTSDPARQNAATWWLQNISVPRMTSGFNYRYDLLPAGTTPATPTALLYHATGPGHLFARTGWDRDAMWVAIVAGKYDESHAHQDQGSFTLFARDWLAVTANVWSHSGINQGTDVHNLVRFVRNGTVARQCESTTRASTLAVTPGEAGAFVANANLTPAFCNNDAVTSWTRQFTFGGRKLTVRDQFAITTGTNATFQINVPTQPLNASSACNGTREVTAGRLRVRVLEPATARISSCGAGPYTEDGGRYRIDITGGTTNYTVELSEI